MSKPHLVLVHGAYHRAWHLGLLKAELEHAGYTVSVPDLPSIGGEHAIATGMSADAEVIKDAIEQAASRSETVVPVFHSYGGIPGSEAAAQLNIATRKKIKRLVYLASFILPEGTPCVPPDRALAPWGATTADGLWRYVPDPIPPFYHDVEPVLAREAASRCVPQCMSALREKTRFAGWRMYPATYIFCKDDRALPYEGQQRLFNALSEVDRKGWETETIEGSHSPFLAKPAECAKLIRKIAGESTDTA